MSVDEKASKLLLFGALFVFGMVLGFDIGSCKMFNDEIQEYRGEYYLVTKVDKSEYLKQEFDKEKIKFEKEMKNEQREN